MVALAMLNSDPVVKNDTGRYEEYPFCNLVDSYYDGTDCSVSQFWKPSERYKTLEEVPFGHKYYHRVINGVLFECFWTQGISIVMPEAWRFHQLEKKCLYHQYSLFE